VRGYGCVSAGAKTPIATVEFSPPQNVLNRRPLPTEEVRKLVKGESLQELKELQRQGISIQAISRLTGWDRKTIRKYMQAAGLAPAYGPRSAPESDLDGSSVPLFQAHGPSPAARGSVNPGKYRDAMRDSIECCACWKERNLPAIPTTSNSFRPRVSALAEPGWFQAGKWLRWATLWKKTWAGRLDRFPPR